MNRSFLAVALAAFLIGAGSQAALASGPHDANCVSCHNLHYAKGSFIVGVQPNATMNNPSANSKISGIDTLCLGCHSESEGIMPIYLSTTHPTGVAPIYVRVPEKLLRDGKMSCVSCHNPHPSNNNYKYLVVDTKKGNDMGVFCAVCHSEQSDTAERNSAGATPLNVGPRAEARVVIDNVVGKSENTKPAASAPAAKAAVAAPVAKTASAPATKPAAKPSVAVKY